MSRRCISIALVPCIATVTLSCGPTGQQSSGAPQSFSQFYENDHLFVVDDLSATRSFRVYDPVKKIESKVAIDQNLKYFHVIPHRGGLAVDSEGQVGLLNWIDGPLHTANARFVSSDRFRNVKMKDILAWGHWASVQVACDSSGQLLITNAQTLSAEVVQIEDFPVDLKRVFVGISELPNSARIQILVSGLDGGNIWSWSVRK